MYRRANRFTRSSTTAMTHVAIAEALNGKAVEWMEPVSDAISCRTTSNSSVTARRDARSLGVRFQHRSAGELPQAQPLQCLVSAGELENFDSGSQIDPRGDPHEVHPIGSGQIGY